MREKTRQGERERESEPCDGKVGGELPELVVLGSKFRITARMSSSAQKLVREKREGPAVWRHFGDL